MNTMKFQYSKFWCITVLFFSIILDIFAATPANIPDQKDSLSRKKPDVISYPFYHAPIISSTGSMTVVSGEMLSTIPTTNLIETLSGRLPSAYFSTNDYKPGARGVRTSLRGMSLSTMIDGISSSIDELDPLEIESISLINSITDRAKLGADAKFNLLMVNTKRGKRGVNQFDVSVESGSMITKHLPTWVNGYENALIYNQIRIIDGLQPKYNADFLNGIKDGNHSLRYPNENYYDYIFNSSGAYNKLGLSYTGGSQNTQYFVFMGYQNEGAGLLKIQDRKLNRFRLRGNLDTKLSDDITLSLDFSGRFNFINIPPNENNITNVIRNYPSYAFPVIANDDPQNFKYGTTLDYGINPIADQNLLGGIINNNQFAQNKIQLKFDLKSILRGLKLHSGMSYTVFNDVSYQRKSGTTFELLEPIFGKTSAGNDTLTFRSNGGIDKISPLTIKIDDYVNQDMSAFANLFFQRTIEHHNIDISIINYFRYNYPRNRYSVVQKNDLSISGKYAFQNKYFVEGVLTYTKDNYLPVKNRNAFFPSVGAAWIMSEESFMAETSYIDFLKVRANYGIIGSSDISNYHLSRTEWSILTNGAVFGPTNGTRMDAANLIQTGNPDLDFVRNKQMELGFDATLFNKSLYVGVNAYNNYQDGIVSLSVSPLIVGNFNKYVNIGIQQFYGIDLSAEYSWNINKNFSYTVGVNVGYKKSNIIADNNPRYDLEWMNEVGNPTDAIYGYVAERLFLSYDDIQNAEKQFLGNLRPGDLKYKDLDGNGKVEPNLDRKMIGHSSPNYLFALNFKMDYKGIGLYVLGTGVADVDINVVGNTYFRPGQNNKYSTHAAKMFNDGTLPTPTTLISTNNALPSTYFLIDGSYFKIKNIELSYKLPETYSRYLNCKQIRFFTRGSNLISFSSVPELDPEAITAGLTNYPSLMTITGGFSIVL